MENSIRGLKIEQHHPCFNKFAWVGNAALRSIREDYRLITPLDHDTHAELHQNISHVPPLSYHMARHTLRQFSQYGNDTKLHNLENLQRSIEIAMQHPRADAIERGVAEMTLYALDLQKPYIDESLPTRLLRVNAAR